MIRLLLVDACVVIDFAKADVSILSLAARHVGEVHVATPVFDEVKDIDRATAVAMGLKLVEPSLDEVLQAAAARGRLSFQDRLCLLIAKSRGWTCVSNDKALRAACTTAGVPLMWGFEVLALLVEERALEPHTAAELATAIAAANKRIGPAVLAKFYARIGVKRGKR